MATSSPSSERFVCDGKDITGLIRQMWRDRPVPPGQLSYNGRPVTRLPSAHSRS